MKVAGRIEWGVGGVGGREGGSRVFGNGMGGWGMGTREGEKRG